MAERLDQLMKLYDADPGDPFVTYAIAMEYMKTGEYEAAIHWLDETIKLDAGYSYAYYQKALAIQKHGRLDDAKAAVAAGLEQAQKAGDQKAVAELRDLLDMLG